MKSWEQYVGGLLIAIRLDSIRRKIVALAVVATLVPALSTAVLSYVANRRALGETIEGELERIGSQAARELDLSFKERFYDVRIFVSSLEVSDNLDLISGAGAGADEGLARLTNYLRGVQGRYRIYSELLVADADGRLVASSRALERARPIPESWTPLSAHRKPVLGEPYRDDVTGQVAVAIGQPILSTDLRFLGVLVATLSFDDVQEIFARFAPGDGGTIDLILDDGRRIVGSGVGGGLEPAIDEVVLARLARAPSGTLEYEDAERGTVLGTVTTAPTVGWSVITRVPTEQAYAQIMRLRNTTLALVSVLLLFVGTVAYFLGLFIVRPLDRLATGAAAVAGGDLSVDLPVTGGGEVGYLTGVFNRMVGQVRRSREELADANVALRRHNEELERLSMTDSLTGLYNRRYVMNEFEKEVQRAERHGRKLAVLMLDVDRFKGFNDKHGHLAGDNVLNGLGRVIVDATREPDVPGRFGGEEFIVLMPDCDLGGAIDAGERIRERLTQEAFEWGVITCSIGAAEYPTHGGTPNALIASADTALYAAKASGRDRVVAAAAPKAPKARKAEAGTSRRRSDASGSTGASAKRRTAAKNGDAKTPSPSTPKPSKKSGGA